LTLVLKMRSARTVTLDQLPTGRSAVVKKVQKPSPTTLRLMELGLVPGRSVQVLKRAPFGGPMQLSLVGTRVSLRAHDARAFEIDA
jgi:Fe2+ transport system protein FeoA